MSDAVLEKKLEIIPTIKDGVTLSLKNIGPILVNVLLWGLTVWIPYLNIGTTIGLAVGIVTKVSRGETIPMTEVFDPKYRKYMGEFFLTAGLVGVGVGVGAALFIAPGIVIGLAWSLSILLVIDKGKNPTEAISLSNNCTYGYKFKMFGVYFLAGLAFFIVDSILMGIGAAVGGGFAGFMMFIVFLISIFQIFVFIGLEASVYRQLTAHV